MTNPKMKPPSAIGRLVREARVKTGFSLTKLAAMCNTSPSQISIVERGLAEPNVKTLRRVANALGYDLEIAFIEQAKPDPLLSKKKKKEK